MEASSLALKVYLILGLELAVLYGCMLFIIQQCKKAFYANTTFLGISFAEAINQKRQTDIAIVKSKGTTHFFFFLLLFSILIFWAAGALIIFSTSFMQIVFMTLSTICYGSVIGFIVMDMDENDGTTGLKLATLTTAAMFIIVTVTGVNFANPIFVATIAFLIIILIFAEFASMFKKMSRGYERKKAIAGIIIFSVSLLASITSVNLSSDKGLNDWDTAISLAFSIYIDIINTILYILDAMGNS